MLDDNPFTPPNSPRDPDPENSGSDEISAGHAAYNVVFDTVIGVNVRGSDNKFQAKFILVSVVLLAVVGTILVALNGRWQLPWYAGALMGAYAGLIFGVFFHTTF